jgi:pimeloyl-ACP methyl ester carboxylesterase
MRSVDLSPLVGGARVDSSKVVYCGESFGGVLGALFAAEEPDVHLFYLDVPGGGVLEYIAPNSPILSIFYKLFVPSTYGLDPSAKLDRFAPFVGMGSAVVDGADPLAFAHHMPKDRSVVIGEVINDEVMPNSSTNALARAMNLPILAPAYDDASGLRVVDGPLVGDVSAVVHFAPANHGDNWSNEAGKREYMPFTEDAIDFVQLPSPIAIKNPVVDVHRQVRELLASYAAGSATLTATSDPVHDFDGDGISDDVDSTPYGP